MLLSVVLLGEVHDNAVQHRLRLEVLRRAFAAGWRPAIAMEQFDRERQGDIDRARAERPGDAQALIERATAPPAGRAQGVLGHHERTGRPPARKQPHSTHVQGVRHATHAMIPRADRPDVPVIMITAYGDAETRRKAIERGAGGLLTKPIDFALLRHEIDSRLGQAA